MRTHDTAPGSLARTHENLPGLPRGRSSLPAEVVGSAQRERLVRAMIAATAEHDYADVMIADVVRRARVSRKTFYGHFTDKESCLLAATDTGVEIMFARVRHAARDVPEGAGPVAALRAALAAYLGFLADEPEFARTFLIAGLAAGPRALERFAAVHRRFASMTRRWHVAARRENPAWPAVPDDVFDALVGSLYELVAIRVRGNRTDEIPALEDTAMRLHLTLFAGWPAG